MIIGDEIAAMESKTIAQLSYEFALKVINLYKTLIENREYILSRQLLKAGTSVGANVEEAGAGQTKKDFIAKMAVASKEARETRYWLRLLEKSQLVKVDLSDYLFDIETMINILTAIVKTSQRNLKLARKKVPKKKKE